MALERAAAGRDAALHGSSVPDARHRADLGPRGLAQSSLSRRDPGFTRPTAQPQAVARAPPMAPAQSMARTQRAHPAPWAARSRHRPHRLPDPRTPRAALPVARRRRPDIGAAADTRRG